MATKDELRYIQAFSRIIGVKEDDAIEYAERKGLNALVDNATQLLSTPVQREKHQAFLDLYRMSSAINTRNPIINSPDTASAYFHSVMDKIHDKEAFVVAFLNTKNRVIDHEVVSVGTINSSIVHPREVFRNAIINKANSVILCHNHPSGDLTPSTEDINITRRLKETGELLGIKVLDHLIINGINQHEVFSFKSKGVLETAGTYDITTSQSIGDTNSNFAGTTKEQGTDFIVPIQEHSYPLPDPSVSISDRNSYGYLDDEMLPLSKERATELFEQDLAIFLLYEDDTESMVFDREDIDNHSGIFGIERINWIDLKDYEAMKEAEGVVSSNYVDSIGFKEQPYFIPKQNYLETAEKSVEQNYNQLDGIINNKPIVVELEQTLREGGTISFLDLPNTVQAEKEEKKTSVVEQLKPKPFIEKEKQKKAPQIGAEMER